MRAAVEQRDTEPLGGTDHDVRPEGARRLEQGEGEQVGGDDRERVPLVGLLDDPTRVADLSGRPRVLHQHTGQRALGQTVGQVGDHHLDAHRLGPRAHHLDRLRQGVGVDDEGPVGLPVAPAHQGHGLGGRGRLVQQRRVGRGQTGEVTHDGLEVQQRLEAALRDLGLVRRVGRVPARVLEHVPLDDRGRDRARVAEADHRRPHGVPVGELAQLRQRLAFGRGLGDHRVDDLLHADGGRHGGVHERVERVVAERREHPLVVARGGADVAPPEGVDIEGR